MSKTGLGKGLSALIPEADKRGEGGVEEIPLSRIDENPYQPRKEFDLEKLTELAESIREHGLVQPVIVRRSGDRYQLIAGERRFKAVGMIGLERIPAIIKDYDDKKVMEIALIENLQREDLNPIEEAEAYKKLRDEFGLTQEEIADTLGKSRSAVANTLRLLNLSPAIQKSVSRGTISMGHARALLGLSDEKLREEIAKKIEEKGLSVRQVEEIVRLSEKAAEEGDVSRETIGSRNKVKDPNILLVEETLKRRLGTKVTIKPGRGRGKIEIEYYSNEDLDRILEVLGEN